MELSSEVCIAPSAVYQPPSTPPSTSSSYPAEPAAVNKRRAIRRNLIEASSLTNSSTLLPYAPLRKSTRRKKISSNEPPFAPARRKGNFKEPQRNVKKSKVVDVDFQPESTKSCVTTRSLSNN